MFKPACRFGSDLRCGFSGTGVPPVVFKPRAGPAQTSVRAVRQETKVGRALRARRSFNQLMSHRLRPKPGRMPVWLKPPLPAHPLICVNLC